jgi:hypothetical protein
LDQILVTRRPDLTDEIPGGERDQSGVLPQVVLDNPDNPDNPDSLDAWFGTVATHQDR